MFAKLLKHEFLNTKRYLGKFTLGALGLGMLTTGVVRLMQLPVFLHSVGGFNALTAALYAFLGGAVLAFVVYALGSGLYPLMRFYKHKFTDEGYLTFTLPVTSRAIFLSSLVNLLIWAAITALTLLTVLVLLTAFGFVESGVVNLQGVRELFEGFVSLFVGTDFSGGPGRLNVLQTLLSALAAAVIAMTSITAGAIKAKKHKVLAAIGFYYLFDLLRSILLSVLSAVVFAATEDNYTASYVAYCVLICVVSLIYIFWGYVLSVNLMKEKLNLP